MAAEKGNTVRKESASASGKLEQTFTPRVRVHEVKRYSRILHSDEITDHEFVSDADRPIVEVQVGVKLELVSDKQGWRQRRVLSNPDVTWWC